MKGELSESIKTLLGIKDVVVDLNEDLTHIIVKVLNTSTEGNIMKEITYTFNYNEGEDKDKEIQVNRIFSGTTRNFIVENGKIIGTFSSDTPIELQAIHAVFGTITTFKKKEETEKTETE